MAFTLGKTVAPLNDSAMEESAVTEKATQEAGNSTFSPEPSLEDAASARLDSLHTTAHTTAAPSTLVSRLSSPSLHLHHLNVSTAPSTLRTAAGLSSPAVLHSTPVDTTAAPVSLTSVLTSTSTSHRESPALDAFFNATDAETTLAPHANWTESLALNLTTPSPYSVTEANWTSGVSADATEGLTNATLSEWAVDLASAVVPTSLTNLTRSVLSEPSNSVTSVPLHDRIPSHFPSPSTSSSDLDPVTVLKTVILALIALVAVTSHGVIIWSVVRQRFLHRPPFYYLLSFCVTELSRALFCLPLVLVSVLQHSVWRYGAAACKLFAFANCFFVYSAALSLLAIAIDRHFSTVYVKVYRRRSRGLVNLVVVLVSWTVAFAVSFPPVLGAGSYVFIPAENQCTFHHRFYRANDTLGFMLVFALVVVVAVFLYFRIFSFLRNHRKMRPLDHPPARSNNWTFFGPGANGQAMINWFNGFGGVQNPFPGGPHPLRQTRPPFGRLVNLQSARNEHLTRLFFVVTLVFGVFWFPYVVTSFWRVFGDGDRLERDFVTSAAWLTYAQVAACPVAYVIARRPQRRLSRTVFQEQDHKEFLLEPRQGK